MSRRVIGAGVIGLLSAWYLQQRGFSVTLLDRGGPERRGTSHSNAGMIVPSHFVPLAAPGVMLQGLKWMSNPRSPFYIKPRLNAELLGWGWRYLARVYPRACGAERSPAAAP